MLILLALSVLVFAQSPPDFLTDGSAPCHDPTIQTTDLQVGFCVSSTTQEFPKGVTYQFVTYEALRASEELNWSEPAPVGKVYFAYGNHRLIKRMSAMKVADQWWYMWGESAWLVQTEAREDGQVCEGVYAVEQGILLFCSSDKNSINKTIKTLHRNLDDVGLKKQ